MFTAQKRQYGNGKDRAGRKFEILTFLYEARYVRHLVQLADDPEDRSWRSSHEIAKALRMTPSQHLRGILEELYQEGLVLIEMIPHRKNVSKSTYTIADNARYSPEWRDAFDQWLASRPNSQQQLPF